MALLRLGLSATLIVVLLSCKQAPEAYRLYIPEHFPDSLSIPERNPLTQAGVSLGRALFYDTRLSGDGQRSCASCHFPSLAFSDGKAVSTDEYEGPQRNSMPLFNLAWYPAFFWDGGVKNLESLAFAPLTHAAEMKNSISEMVANLQRHEQYPALFQLAFGSDSIYSALVARALAQYVRTLTSYHSAWDSVAMGRRQFDELQLKGQQLFSQHCAACHTPPLFTDFRYHNIGLDTTWVDEREFGLLQGRFRITRDSADLGKFRTPSLRNSLLTAPYMHDGRFPDLTAVFEDINRPQSKHKLSADLRLDTEEQAAITRFLASLTDYHFICEGIKDSLIAVP
jgi:cytochrome c peroxidase